MIVQFAVLLPAFVAIYAATGAWVFSCEPLSRTVDVIYGGVLYGWIGFLVMCTEALVLDHYGCAHF